MQDLKTHQERQKQRYRDNLLQAWKGSMIQIFVLRIKTIKAILQINQRASKYKTKRENIKASLQPLVYFSQERFQNSLHCRARMRFNRFDQFFVALTLVFLKYTLQTIIKKHQKMQGCS